MNAFVQYHVLGFQTKLGQANFCRFACEHMGGDMVSDELLRVHENVVSVSTIPVGINVESFAAAARRPEAEEHIQWLPRRGELRVNIIWVDRLDYTKGLPDRFRSFKRWLELYFQNCKATTLMQIAPPTREEVKAGESLCRHSA